MNKILKIFPYKNNFIRLTVEQNFKLKFLCVVIHKQQSNLAISFRDPVNQHNVRAPEFTTKGNRVKNWYSNRLFYPADSPII